MSQFVRASGKQNYASLNIPDSDPWARPLGRSHKTGRLKLIVKNKSSFPLPKTYSKCISFQCGTVVVEAPTGAGPRIAHREGAQPAVKEALAVPGVPDRQEPRVVAHDPPHLRTIKGTDPWPWLWRWRWRGSCVESEPNSRWRARGHGSRYDKGPRVCPVSEWM